MKRTAAVIAAAGLSSRMGDFKPLLPFGDLCIAEHLTEMLKKAGIDPVVMVTGYRGEELRKSLSGKGILFVENRNYATTDMLYSLKLGFQALLDLGCNSQVLVMPVDVPAITEQTVRIVAESEGSLVRTCCNGHHGHPVKMDVELMQAALRYCGQGGLSGFMRACGEEIMEVAVMDEGSFVDADTKEEYKRLLELDGSRGRGYPDGDALRWFLEISHMPEPVRRHSEAVSRKALSMAVNLQQSGILLDLNLVRSAALLHDIGKGSPNHASVGAKILKENGYGKVAEIVRQHHDLDNIPKKADETLVVYLADKLIQGDREVSLEERFAGSFLKCQNSREAMESHERRKLQAFEAYHVWENGVLAH